MSAIVRDDRAAAPCARARCPARASGRRGTGRAAFRGAGERRSGGGRGRDCGRWPTPGGRGPGPGLLAGLLAPAEHGGWAFIGEPIALAGGSTVALGLWGILAARAVSSAFYVRARLRLERGHPSGAGRALGAQVVVVAFALAPSERSRSNAIVWALDPATLREAAAGNS